MFLFNSIVRPVIRRFGIDLVRYSSRPDPRYPPVLRNRWMSDLGVTLVLDVGANVGQYGSDVRRWGYKGRLVSFEPLHTAYAQLVRAAHGDQLWETAQFALGAAPGRASINVAGNSTSSSLLPMLARHRDAAPRSAYVGTEDVEVVTLDSLLGRIIRPDDIVWLKMDVQGYELSVLDGAPNLLKQVSGIECESSLVPLYQGEPLVEAVLQRLAGVGFRLAMTTEAFYDPETLRTLQLNGVFLREHHPMHRVDLHP